MAIRVLVHGALGKMGREIISGLSSDMDFTVVGAVDKNAVSNTLPLPDGKSAIPLSPDLASVIALSRPQVMVDFSIAEATRAAAPIAAGKGTNMVIGTTGLSDKDLEEIRRLCQENRVGAVVSSNFSLGAVMMIHLSKIAARYFDYAEIIEMHHEQKADAPSGTSISTAQAMLKARGKPFLNAVIKKETVPGTRGGQIEGIALHSLRMPGLMAHQEVVLGETGETLRIRHDTITRECYLPGIKRAAKEVIQRQGLTVGLDALLGL